MIKIKANKPLAPLTTLGIGGPAEFFSEVFSLEDIKEAFAFATEKKLPLTVIGGGSNLLISDEGIEGLVLKIAAKGKRIVGTKLIAGAGEMLDDIVKFASDHELSGLEHLAGIPGTVGGAIYGNAGAYGREMKDLVSLVLTFDGNKIKTFGNKECKFSYRESIFSRKPMIILEATLELFPSHREVIGRISEGYRTHRECRFGKDLKVPGSFFKNIDTKDILPEVLKNIPRFAISGGKVQAGWLLEHSGALGARRGNVKIAPFHGNLFINEGGATARDFILLAQEYRQKVRERFGIELLPEVQVLGFKNNPFGFDAD